MMEKPARQYNKVFFVFAGICLLALPVIIISAFSVNAPLATETTIPLPPDVPVSWVPMKPFN